MASIMNYIIRFFLVIFTSLFITNVFAHQFQIIIDAGSTGSRLHLFEYEQKENALPMIKNLFSEKTTPGLSSFRSNPQEVGPHGLKKLLDDVSLKLQNLGIDPKTVKIHILATGGMRVFVTSRSSEYL